MPRNKSRINFSLLEAGQGGNYFKMALRGFTLIEVVVAMSILSIGIAVVLRYFLYSSSMIRLIETENKASVFLGSTMDDFIIKMKEGAVLPEKNNATEVTINDRKMSWTWEYLPIASDLEDKKDRLGLLRLKISWLESRKDKFVQLERYCRFKKRN